MGCSGEMSCEPWSTWSAERPRNALRAGKALHGRACGLIPRIRDVIRPVCVLDPTQGSLSGTLEVRIEILLDSGGHMRHPPLAPGWIDSPHHERSIGDLPLASGETLKNCRLVWVEHGERNARGDNTILALCAIGSAHHRLDFLIGPGRALDTRRFHVIAVDALGNALSSSPSNHTSQGGAAFPAITIADMVESQSRLLDLLGVTRLFAVVGASMGGMQALQWAVSQPMRVARLIALTAMARTSRWSQIMNELSRRAMFADDDFTQPRPREEAMKLWAPLTQLVVASTPRAAERFANRAAMRAEMAGLETAFHSNGPDAFDWLCQTRAYDAHDVGLCAHFHGDTTAALSSVRARTLVLAPPLDLYNPAECSREIASGIPHSRFLEIPSILGHRSATATSREDAAFLNQNIAEFLLAES